MSFLLECVIFKFKERSLFAVLNKQLIIIPTVTDLENLTITLDV